MGYPIKIHDDGIAQNGCQTASQGQPAAVECRLYTGALKLVFMSIWKGQKQPFEMAVSLEYCRLTDTVIQAWSVLQHGFFKGNFVGKEEFAALNHVLNDLAKKYQVTPTAIALALGPPLSREDAGGHRNEHKPSMS